MMLVFLLFFIFNAQATIGIYTLSLHDALPIYRRCASCRRVLVNGEAVCAEHPSSGVRQWSVGQTLYDKSRCGRRSEEHTSELQSRLHLVCRLPLEIKKQLRLLACLLCPHPQCF